MHQNPRDVAAADAGVLAADMALFHAVEAGGANHLYRCWQTSRPVVVLGRHRRVADDVYEDACRADGVPVVHRESGGGTVVLVGVPTPDMKVPDLPLIDVFGRGGALKSSWYGDCLPTRDFPMLVDLYRQGRLDLDAFVSEEIGIGDIEAAFEKMHHAPEDGQSVLRSVVIL